MRIAGGPDVQFYSQQGEDAHVYERYVRNKITNGFFVELGALDGVTYSNTKFFEDALGFTGVLIEPVPEQFALLRENRPRCITFNYAVSTKEGPVDFLGSDALGGMVHTMADGFRRAWYDDPNVPERREARPYTVNAIPLDKLLRRAGVDRIDLFFVDVEGGELEVLQTMDWRIPVHLVVIELDGHNPAKDRQCRSLLRRHGFAFESELGNNDIWIAASARTHVLSARERALRRLRTWRRCR